MSPSAACRLRAVRMCHLCRFNLMNNWVRYKERVDVWVMRFSSEALHRYWGLTNFQLADARRAIDMVQVWLADSACPPLPHHEAELWHPACRHQATTGLQT